MTLVLDAVDLQREPLQLLDWIRLGRRHLRESDQYCHND